MIKYIYILIFTNIPTYLHASIDLLSELYFVCVIHN